MTTTKIRHKPQREFLKHQARFNFLLTGRRGGKTISIVEDIMRTLPLTPQGGELFYIGPTNQQAKEIIWEPIEDRLDQLKWYYQPRSSKSRFEFRGRRKLYVIGAEKIRRIRGHKVKKAYLDEVAYFNVPLKNIWKAVRPTLTDLRGGAIMSTTPDGKGSDAYQFHLDILRKPDWKFAHWKTIDNPFIDPQEIEDARAEMDPKSFTQEYEATWESFEGLAYYCFKESEHIKATAPFDFDLPLNISLDFNVNPTTLLVNQKHGDVRHWKKEYSQKNSSTPATVKSFCEDFKEHKDRARIKIHGDATGGNRKSNTGFSDYKEVQEILTMYGFNYEMHVLGSNPAIIDRVNWANAALMNARGESRTIVNPNCVDLILDLSSQELEGRFPSDKGNLGHKADAFGYFEAWQKLAGERKAQGTVQL